MATLYISEYARLGLDAGKFTQAPAEPAITGQTKAIAAGSAQSNAFNAATRFVRLHTDAICSIKFGTNPTATATDARMAANATEYFAVNAGDKVAVIVNT